MVVEISLPDWLSAETLPTHIESIEDRMRFVIALSRRNFENATGGPFAAAVFEEATGKLVAAGVNRVMPCHCSSAHAEVTTLSFAQKRLGTHDLGGTGMPAHQIVVNWRPCTMCMGAVIWSGATSLVIAGSDDSVERITGFDEGPMPHDWQGELEKRGIRVTDNVLYDEAVAVFHAFAASGAVVYNGRGGGAKTSG